jgi:two-component system OmpR family sensor kinase
VQGSGDDLHRLALNLIENAFLHTPTGTPVVASVRSEDGQVVLEVADRGPGVPEDRRDRVFERFARSDAGRTATGGSGLGLAIVRAVAEAHDGSVQLREAEGGGALFSVRIPTLVAQPTPASGVVGAETDPSTREPKEAETS